MEQFKAKRDRNFYKNTNAWIDAIYRNNKEIIDKSLPERAGTPELRGKSSKAIFKQMIREYVQEGRSYEQATKTLARTDIFSSRAQRQQYNAVAGLKGDAESYKIFRELSKEHGRYTKLNPELFKWSYADNAYIYDERVMISYSNSPFGIVVSKVK